MKKLHRYVTKNFILTFFVVLLFTVFLFALSDFFSRLGTILKSSVSLKYIIEYYAFYTPFVIYFSLPFIYALSSVISLGYLSFRNEIIVMRSSGLSIFRISMPILVLSVFVAVIMFFGKEDFVNYGLDKAAFIKSHYFEKEELNSTWLNVGNVFLKAKNIDEKKKELFGVTAFYIDNNFSNIKRVLVCSKAVFENKKLIFYNGYWKDFPFKDKHLFSKLSMFNKRPFVSLVSESKLKEPYLKDVIKMLKKGKDKNYYLSIALFRFLYPLSCSILSLLSLVFILRITPRKSGFIGNVFLSAVVFLVYIASFQIIVSMSKYSMINPFLSIPIFMLFWIAVSLYNLLELGV